MKMKKLVALVTAAALCLGMSMTAFAADAANPSNGDDDASSNITAEEALKKFEDKYNGGHSVIWAEPDKDKNGKDLPGIWGSALYDALYNGDVTPEEYKTILSILNDSDKMLDIIGDTFKVPDGAKAVVIGAANFEYWDYVDGVYMQMKELPEGGIDQNIYVGEAEAKGLKNGDKIYVLHYKEDGTWETIEGTVNTVNGGAYVNVHFDSLSPVAFVKVMSNGKVIALDKKGEPVKKSGKSPKTGEF